MSNLPDAITTIAQPTHGRRGVNLHEEKAKVGHGCTTNSDNQTHDNSNDKHDEHDNKKNSKNMTTRALTDTLLTS